MVFVAGKVRGQCCALGGKATEVPVPKVRYIAEAAEMYFFESLRRHYSSLGFYCYRQYDYAAHMNEGPLRSLSFRRGNVGPIGFSDPQLNSIHELLWARFGYKPDFMAISRSSVLIAEVGTRRCRREKIMELQKKLEELNRISRTWSFPEFKPVFKPANYRPAEGEIQFPIGGSLWICTRPTWNCRFRGQRYEPSYYGVGNSGKRDGTGVTDGILLYEVHKLKNTPNSHPVPVPNAVRNELKEFLSMVRPNMVSYPLLAEEAASTEVTGSWVRNAVREYGTTAVALGIFAAICVVLTPGIPDEIAIVGFATALANGG